MIEDGDNNRPNFVPLVTWTIVALNVLIYIWDRQWQLQWQHLWVGSQVIFADLVMRPHEIVAAARGGDRFPLVTLFTALFLHGNGPHLIGNMIFLLVFGPGVEQALSATRFAIYYFFWGLVAWGTQIYVDPTSMVPIIGASGAIGGVLGCYFLLFPTKKIDLSPLPFEISTWILLGLWFLYQVFSPTEGVANWAHVGGFMAGMASVLIAGGREKLLRGRTDLEPESV